MAYLDNSNPDDPNKKAATADPTAGPVLGAPTATAIQGDTSGAGGAAAAAAAPTHSGSFTNLNDYVTANAGNDATMGNAVKSGAQGATSTADTALTGFQGDTSKAIEGGTVRDDGTNAKVTALSTAQTGAAPIDDKQFGRQYNANYKTDGGPQNVASAAGYGDTNSAVNKVADFHSGVTGDNAARGGLLNDIYGGAGQQYSKGERSLDSFILGSGQQGQQALSDVGASTNGYGDKWSGIKGLLGDQITAAGATSQATRDATRGAVGTAQTGFQTKFDPLTQQAADKTAAGIDQGTALASKDWGSLKAAGVSQNALDYLRTHPDANLNGMVNKSSAYGLGDLADAGDATNYGRLQSLIGGAGGVGDTKYTAGLAAKGGQDASLNGGQLSTLNQIGDADDAMGRDQWKRDTAYNQAMADAGTFNKSMHNTGGMDPAAVAKEFGISPDDLNAMSSYGLDPTKFLSKGGALTLGNELGSHDSGQWGKLLSLIGQQPSSLAATQGGAVNFDKAGFGQAVAAGKQATDDRAAARAAAAKQASDAAQAQIGMQAEAAAAPGATQDAIGPDPLRDPAGAAGDIYTKAKNKWGF